MKDEINTLLCKIEQIIEHEFKDCLEKDQVLIKLRELVFWIEYYDEEKEVEQ